jgi:hypothetical protein
MGPCLFRWEAVALAEELRAQWDTGERLEVFGHAAGRDDP